MATRKAQDDQTARDAAATLAFSNVREGGMAGDVDDDVTAAQAAIDAFPYAEFETTTAKVAGETKTFRRVVLTSEWEIVADQPQAE